MEMVGCARSAGLDLLLRALRLRQYFGACPGDVHAVPDCRHSSRRASVSGRRLAGLFLKSVRGTDSLRHNTRTYIFRRRLRHSAEMVAAGIDRLRAEYSDLGARRAGLVEDSGLVVKRFQFQVVIILVV